MKRNLPSISAILYTSKTLANGEHPIMLRVSYTSQSRKEQWKKDFIEQTRDSIKRVVSSAHCFKILHRSDDFEPYQAICTTRYGITRTDDLVLLKICQPNVIQRWEDNVLYIILSLLIGFSVLVITLMHSGALNEGFRKSSEE